MVRALLTPEEKKTYFLKFNVDGLLRGDYQSRMNGYATARQNGWMSANDIRELENLDRIPEEAGGDLYLINGNMTKLADAGIFATGGVNVNTHMYKKWNILMYNNGITHLLRESPEAHARL